MNDYRFLAALFGFIFVVVASIYLFHVHHVTGTYLLAGILGTMASMTLIAIAGETDDKGLAMQSLLLGVFVAAIAFGCTMQASLWMMFLNACLGALGAGILGLMLRMMYLDIRRKAAPKSSMESAG